MNNILFVKAVYADSLRDRFNEVTSSSGEGGVPAFADFVNKLLAFAVPLGIFCAVVLLGYAAYVMITSAGNPEKLNEAREIITNAIIGVIMIGIGVVVLNLISNTLGLGVG